MRLFDFVDDDVVGAVTTHTKHESPVLIKSEEAPRVLERPKSANPLFELVDSEVVVKGLSPIQRQRLEDGTPVTRGNRTGLRPPEPTLYLEGLSKGVNEDGVKDDRANPRPQVDPDSVVKAFLDFEG